MTDVSEKEIDAAADAITLARDKGLTLREIATAALTAAAALRAPTSLAPGCCSAISPCGHQQRSPATICEVCAQAALRAPVQEAVRRVRHKKRGTTYEVLGDAEMQLSRANFHYIYEGNLLTVYRCEKTGKLWCRFPGEMSDGRFEAVQSDSAAMDESPGV